MEDSLLEKVEDLLRRNTENVSANHWTPAIHEDKHAALAQQIVYLLKRAGKKNQKKQTEPPKPPRDREIHVGGFGRHKNHE